MPFHSPFQSRNAETLRSSQFSNSVSVLYDGVCTNPTQTPISDLSQLFSSFLGCPFRHIQGPADGIGKACASRPTESDFSSVFQQQSQKNWLKRDKRAIFRERETFLAVTQKSHEPVSRPSCQNDSQHRLFLRTNDVTM